MADQRKTLRADGPAVVAVAGEAQPDPDLRQPDRPQRRPRRGGAWRRLIGALFALMVAVGFAGAVGVYWVFETYGRDLPDHSSLANYEPPITTRVYAGDGRLLAEYAIERRIFVPFQVIPERVINAFLSAEDKTFYSHSGIDIAGIVRAMVTNVQNMGTDRRLIGASTITQQVAKNFLVGNEVSYERKIKEIILSFRIEEAFTKDQILELYLNEIYLGRGAYGVAAAALNYFNRKLDELTIAEAAFLAALPKAPNNYDPERFPEAAKARRDWVISRMLEDGHITVKEAWVARARAIEVRTRGETETAKADYFAEEIRREIAGRFGEDALYRGGLVVHATVNPHLQAIADRELRRGLETYDRRHGWRGPLGTLVRGADSGSALPADWPDRLADFPRPVDMPDDWSLAVVLEVEGRSVTIGLAAGATGTIPFAELAWARPWLKDQRVGATPRSARGVLDLGDVIAVAPVTEAGSEADAGDSEDYPPDTYSLKQIPDVDGALVAVDPHTGRVLAMAGGYAFGRSEFNRATQALRQPGSAFKPFVYLAGLEHGFTPNTLILDAPIVIDQGPGMPRWRPENYTRKFYGPTTLRVGLEKSRNLMTVRLAQTIGMKKVAATALRFNIFDEVPLRLSYALGAGETTLLRLTSAYAMLVNGGKRLEPTLIDRIQNRRGETLYRHDTRPCDACQPGPWAGQPVPALPDPREPVTDPASAYQIVSMLQGVVQRGTGVRVAKVDKPIAGKTGTTNDNKDTWFVGFTPDLAVGVFVGFDEPRSLGSRETGSSAAAPVFRDFMIAALKDAPATPFRVPPDVRLVRVDARTGRPAAAGGRGVILEAFKPDSVPTRTGRVLTGVNAATAGPSSGTGGLY